jgi:hypothetical protein
MSMASQLALVFAALGYVLLDYARIIWLFAHTVDAY